MSYTYQNLLMAVWNLVNILIRVALLLVVLMMTWFGIKMASARSDAEAFSKAKKGMLWAIVGAAVIFGVWIIIATVQHFAAGLTG